MEEEGGGRIVHMLVRSSLHGLYFASWYLYLNSDGVTYEGGVHTASERERKRRHRSREKEAGRKQGEEKGGEEQQQQQQQRDEVRPGPSRCVSELTP